MALLVNKLTVNQIAPKCRVIWRYTNVKRTKKNEQMETGFPD